MRTIFILLDSLNRNYLNTYGCDWVKTPNIDRLAMRSMVFDDHYCGSMPCMPAILLWLFTGGIIAIAYVMACLEWWSGRSTG